MDLYLAEKGIMQLTESEIALFHMAVIANLVERLLKVDQ